MDKFKRTCNQVGHQEQNPTHICTTIDCKLKSRWVCGECFKNKIHEHNQIDQGHIMNKDDFLNYLNDQVQPLIQLEKNQNQIQRQCVDLIRNYSNKLKEFVGNFKQEFLNTKLAYEIKNYNKLLEKTKKEFEQLDHKEINDLLNINSQNFRINYRNSLKTFELIVKSNEQIFDLMKQMIELNQNNKGTESKLQTIKILNDNWFEYLNSGYLSTCQISQNKQFLVVGGFEKRLQIYDLDTKENVYSVDLENIVRISKFTSDAKYLVFGDDQGYLYRYQLQKEFKEMYRERIHQSQISDLILADNDSTLTCSYDKSIILTNISQNKQLLKIQNVHTDQIRGVDYHQQKSLIASCSDDKSIKLFNSKTGQILFQKEDAHKLYIQQVQFIANDQLISSNINDLFLWQMDHSQKQLTVIKQIEQKNYNVSSILNNQKVCVVCEKSIKLYDDQLNLIQEIGHKITDFLYYSRLRQLNSLKYLIIPGRSSLQVMQKQ